MATINPTQTEFINKTADGDIPALINILSQSKLDVNFVDDHGMTPLHHAAYKGSKEVVQLLLHHGAEVNYGQHEHNYTALHFAALSGNPEVCQILLGAGAKSHAVNSVGRTPSQMAAFVGNHACVVGILSFVPKSDIDYYTEVRGLEKEPKLPPFLASAFHKFIMHVNLNPIRIALNLQKCQSMMDNLPKLKIVLELMRDREMSRGVEPNERMSFKFHYLSFITSEIIKCKEQQTKKKESDCKVNDDKKLSDPVEVFIKKMLKTNKGEISEYQDNLIRECVREFPNREFLIFREMVTNLATSNTINSLAVVVSAINGQRVFANEIPICNTCGEEKPAKKCSKCKAVQYCDRECQRLHWFIHKKGCARTITSRSNSTSETGKQEAIQAATDALKEEIQILQLN